MRIFTAGLLLIAAFSRAEAQASFHIVIDYLDSVVILDQPKDVLRFHISAQENRPFICGTLNDLPPVEIRQVSNSSYVVRARATSLGPFAQDLGVGAKYSSDNWPGAMQILPVPVRFTVLPDSGLRLEPFAVPVALQPDYATRRWVGDVPLRIVNRTPSDVSIIDMSVVGKALVDTEAVFSRSGAPLGSHILSANETDSIMLGVRSTGGLPLASKRDTARVQVHAVIGGVDTILYSTFYVLWQQPVVKPESVVGSPIHYLRSRPGAAVLDTFRITKSAYGSLAAVVGKADWFNVDKIVESDSITEITFQLSDTRRSLLRATPSLVYHTLNFVGDAHDDTLNIEVNLATTEIDRLSSWTSVTLPHNAMSARAGVAVDGTVVIPFGEDSVAWQVAGGGWITVDGPGSTVSDVQRLNSGDLLVRGSDSLLYRSTDQGETWTSMMDSLAQFRHAANFPETWGSEVRVDQMYQVGGKSILLLAHNWYQTWAYGGEAYWYLLGSEDGIHWRRVADNVAPSASAMLVDSSSSLARFTRIRSRVRNDSLSSYGCVSAEGRGSYRAIGTQGGGVLEFNNGSEVCTNFMQGNIEHLACTANGSFFAADDHTLWLYDSVQDVWELTGPWEQGRIRALFLDFRGHLDVLTDSALYHSNSQYLHTPVRRESDYSSGPHFHIVILTPEELGIKIENARGVAKIFIADACGEILASQTCSSTDASEINVCLPIQNLSHGNHFVGMQTTSGAELIGFSH